MGILQYNITCQAAGITDDMDSNTRHFIETSEWVSEWVSECVCVWGGGGLRAVYTTAE